MKSKTPILLVTHDRPYLLEKVLTRLLRFTDWNLFELWILDNASKDANRRVIGMFQESYDCINVYSSNYNQIAVIQNEIIAKLKSDVYIKLDDDVLVPAGWTDAFMEVFCRNYDRMGFGSVIIPINGFGWIPFLQIMNLMEEIKQEFPAIPLTQGCTDVAVWNNPAVCEYIWRKCLDIDKTTETFILNQGGTYEDMVCPYRYSLCAIVFSHKFWEKMGGWKVGHGYRRKIRKYKSMSYSLNLIARMSGERRRRKLEKLVRVINGLYKGRLGVEEEHAHKFSVENGLIIPVTTQGIVYHFSFFPLEQHLLNTIYLRLQ